MVWQGAAENLSELHALREEVFRLGKLTEQAISALREFDTGAAERLERELGVPIETLRHSTRRDP